MDETLIADLIRAGVSADLVGRVANAIAFRGNSAEILDERRLRDRERKRKKAKLQQLKPTAPEANDAGDVRGISAESAEASLTLLTSLSSKPKRRIRESKKESKQLQLVTPRKGTRLSSGVQISNEEREFAWTLGFDDVRIDRMWAEFVDYWSAVPGHRGVKLSWSSTWRNRVRSVAERKGNGAFQVYAGKEPRRGSRDDTRERLVRALDQLDDFAEGKTGANGSADGGETGAPVIGRIPQLKRS